MKACGRGELLSELIFFIYDVSQKNVISFCCTLNYSKTGKKYHQNVLFMHVIFHLNDHCLLSLCLRVMVVRMGSAALSHCNELFQQIAYRKEIIEGNCFHLAVDV